MRQPQNPDIVNRGCGERIQRILKGPLRVVRAARKRARDDLMEAFAPSQLPEGVESRGSDELDDGQVFFGRLKVLSHREDVDTCPPSVLHYRFDLGISLAEAQHN